MLKKGGLEVWNHFGGDHGESAGRDPEVRGQGWAAPSVNDQTGNPPGGEGGGAFPR